MKKIHFILAVLSLILIAACSQSQPTAPVGSGTPVGDTPSQAVPAPGVDPDTVDEMIVVEEPTDDSEQVPSEKKEANPTVNEINVIAKQWEFEPNPIVVNKGDNIVLKVKSVDVDHGIAIPDFRISQRLEAGKTEIIEFTADKQGEFTFFCNVACGSGHRHMKGALIVE